MNPLYDKFIKEHPLISTGLQVFSQPNEFQKELLRDSEYGYFIKKTRQAGATTALASFVSYYLYTHPFQCVLYLSFKYDIGKKFVKTVMIDAINSGYAISSSNIKIGSLNNVAQVSIGCSFGLIVLDDVSRKQMTDEVISTLRPHGLNAIWLCTTSLI